MDSITTSVLSRSAWAALMDSLSDGVVCCREGRIDVANPAFAGLARRELSELLGLPLEELLEDARGGLQEPGVPAARECRLVRGPEDRLPVRAVCFASADGEQIWVITEVTPRADAERLLRETQSALRDARQECRTLEERIERAVSEREDLVGVVSHELRTPVTVISGYCRLLLSGDAGPLNPEQQRFLEATSKSAQRLNELISTLLEAAAQATGEVSLQAFDAPFAPTVHDVVAQLKPLLEQKRVRLEMEFGPEAARIHFDPMRLQQVLTNLLCNAIRYAPPLSIIRLGTAESKLESRRAMEVSISDEGSGVAPSDRERIFEPYVRASDPCGPAGLGLGLAICRRVVEAHGGEIGVGEAPGGGARFTFALPIEAPEDPS